MTTQKLKLLKLIFFSFFLICLFNKGIAQNISSLKIDTIAYNNSLRNRMKHAFSNSSASINNINTLETDEDKARVLVNITKFVEWPEQAAFFTIGLYQSNPFDGVLVELLKNTNIGKKWILVVYDDLEKMKTTKCNLLYIPKKHENDIDNIIAQTSTTGILTVGDGIDGFCKKKGIININGTNTEKRFQVNVSKAQKEKLFISSKLLDLAEIVN